MKKLLLSLILLGAIVFGVSIQKVSAQQASALPPHCELYVTINSIPSQLGNYPYGEVNAFFFWGPYGMGAIASTEYHGPHQYILYKTPNVFHHAIAHAVLSQHELDKNACQQCTWYSAVGSSSYVPLVNGEASVVITDWVITAHNSMMEEQNLNER